MGHRKPTLGGLKKLKEGFSLAGFDLPILQMNIWKGSTRGGRIGIAFVPGEGDTISIDEAIKKYGEGYRVEDVRLCNEDKSLEVMFVSESHSLFPCMDDGFNEVEILCSKNDPEFINFLESEVCGKLIYIAQKGIFWQSLFNRLFSRV